MNPVYHQAKFINSAPNLKHAPPDHGLEIAFAGRSNAGKSSALNTLTRQNALARISKTPGRTQMLNFFAISEQLRFVDLPGYGFASAPLAIKQVWQKAIEDYMNRRKSLCGIVLVMDVRHPLTEFDWQMLQWCEHAELPVHVLLTKADKLSFGASKNALLQVRQELSGAPIPLTVQLFSSLKKSGVDEAHDALDHLFAGPSAN
jgi:GTP-binding protein